MTQQHPDDPFLQPHGGLAERLSINDEAPSGWSNEVRSIWLFRLEFVNLEANVVELPGARLRRLEEADIEAIRSAQERIDLGLGFIDLRPRRWDEFGDAGHPVVLEVEVPPSEYPAARGFASYIRRKAESALRITAGRTAAFVTPYPAAYQLDTPGSAIGLHGLSLDEATAELYRLVPVHARHRLAGDAVPELQGIYEAQTAIDDNRVRIALRRFNIAAIRSDDGDALIDLWVGLEALFSDGPADITYKAALRIAYYIERDGQERTKLFPALKKSYSTRSKLVHGATYATDTLRAARRDAREGLRRSLHRILSQVRAPVITEIDDAIASGG